MATLASDTFTETSDTALGSHTPTFGPAWAVLDGTMTVVGASDTLTGTGGSPYFSGVVDVGATTGDAVTLSCDVTIGTATLYIASFYFRVVDKDNGWIAALERDGAVAFLAFYDRTANVDTLIGGTAVNFAGTLTSTTQTMTLTVSGTSMILSCTDPGNPLLTTSHTSSTRQSATKHGFLGYNGGSYVAQNWDNFLLTGTAVGGPAARPFWSTIGARRVG